MELAKIEQLLEAYFEGNTSLLDERTLRTYFSKADVAPHLAMYKPLFNGLDIAKNEVSKKEVKLPTSKSKNVRVWWYGIAASLVLAIGLGNYMFNQPSFTQEEQEALAAFEESKDAMRLLSQNFNKGAEELRLINQFTKTTNKILK